MNGGVPIAGKEVSDDVLHHKGSEQVARIIKLFKLDAKEIREGEGVSMDLLQRACYSRMAVREMKL